MGTAFGGIVLAMADKATSLRHAPFGQTTVTVAMNATEFWFRAGRRPPDSEARLERVGRTSHGVDVFTEPAPGQALRTNHHVTMVAVNKRAGPRRCRRWPPDCKT